MDAKALYSNSYSKMKNKAEKDFNSEDARILERARERKEKYGAGWESVNINEVVERNAPGPLRREKKGKLIYYNEDETRAVVADLGGGYCRVQDLTKKTKYPQYLDQYGNDAHLRVTEKGTKTGRSPDEFNRVTHYRIKKREEM